jgi:hypothetical protein
VSVGPNPPVDINQVEQARRQIQRLAEEIAQLSEMELAPAEYYGEFLRRVLQALQAPAGAVWLRTPQGNLQLQYQINMAQVGLDRAENSRAMHNELLRQAHMKGQPGLLWPNSSLGPTENGAPPAGNPTDYVILLAPILVDKQVAGLVEVWQDPNRGHDAQAGFLQFIIKLAALAAGYTRNHQLRTMVGQEQLWRQLEKYAKDIHGSLNPTEVSYLVVNEGRRLCECDRVAVAIRSGPYADVSAISGADVVEKRSNLVQLMRALFDAVLAWGERLVYSGTKDDALPPGVLNALDAYLAESNSKLLVVMPLRDERETNKKKPARSAIMMECFEPAAAPEQMVARLEIVGKHATAALYNAAEYKRIPMRFLWLPLAKIQEGLGGKARFIITCIALGIVALIACMVFIPYPLKMEAKGQLLPKERAWVFSPMEGHIVEIKEDLKPNMLVANNQELFRVSSNELREKIQELRRDIEANNKSVELLSAVQNRTAEQNLEMEKARITRDKRRAQLEDLRKRVNAVHDVDGDFWIRAPMEGLILTADFRETLKNRLVRPNEPLIRIGKAHVPNLEDWEVELKIPQKHIGQVRAAFAYLNVKELDVDMLIISAPTATYSGKLHIDMIAREAVPNRNDNNEPEPVVIARVRIAPKKDANGNPDIAKEDLVPRHLLWTGIEVHSRVRCGNHAMGYSLFYGVWEFIYEKIVFFF